MQITAALKQAFAVQSWPAQKRWFLLRLLCAAIWTIELFWLQKISFAAVPWVRFPILVQFIRLYFDIIFSVALVLILRRRWLISLFVINLVTLVTFGSYAVHFHRPLMPLRVIYQLDEAWTLRSQFLDLLGTGTIALFLATFAIKCYLLYRAGQRPQPSWSRAPVLIAALFLYALPLVAIQFTHLRLNVRPSAGNGRNVYAYGYTLPWVCDLIANRSLQAQARQAEQLMSVRFERLSPVEKPIAIPGPLVILQLESIDGPAIDARVNGKAVMPFLHELKDRSMYFRLQSFHFNGSCDMDYAAVTDVEPYSRLVPYRLPGLKYTNSLPAFMKRHGFKTYFFHGNGSIFYERGLVIDRLGFDGVYFKEQIASRGFKSSIIGFRDADVLRCVLEKVDEQRKVCVFAITLDSHVPFHQLEPEEMKLFPGTENQVELFLNAANHVDSCLRDFVTKLPEGTTVVMYGDHTPSLFSPIYSSDVVNGKDYVGCLIFSKGSDLAQAQQTRNTPLATDGTLNLLDIMSYLRFSIESGGKDSAPVQRASGSTETAFGNEDP